MVAIPSFTHHSTDIVGVFLPNLLMSVTTGRNTLTGCSIIQLRRIKMPTNKGGQDQSELVKLAIVGIDVQIRELQEKRAQLVQMASGAAAAPKVAAAAAPAAKAAPAGKKRVFSAATRNKLKLAAKRRWARQRAEAKAADKQSAAKKAAPKAAKAAKSE
jgi:hypothetical protein